MQIVKPLMPASGRFICLTSYMEARYEMIGYRCNILVLSRKRSVGTCSRVTVHQHTLSKMDSTTRTLSTVLINRVSDQRLSCRWSRLDDTLKGNRVPVKAIIFKCVCYFCKEFLRQEFTGELGFKFNSIALVVNWRFDVIDSEKTGDNWV